MSQAHQALADAEACEALLCRYWALAESEGIDIRELVTPGSAGPWPTAPANRAPTRARGAPRAAPATTFLRELAERRPTNSFASQGAAAYEELLDRALEDRRLSPEEGRDLISMADLYDLSGRELALIHDSYLDSVCDAALADGRITKRERYDLELVADLLGVRDLDRRLSRARVEAPGSPAPARHPDDDLRGKTVCFTGELLCSHRGQRLSRNQATQLAEQAGLTVHPRVTKRLDVLVVADPESSSAKARKAREYGTRVIAETRFWSLIGVVVE